MVTSPFDGRALVQRSSPAEAHAAAAPAAFQFPVSLAPVGAMGRIALLVEGDFDIAASSLSCRPEAVRAVVDVETATSGGFLRDGRPDVLFESHQFSRLTGGRFDASHPEVSQSTWVRDYGPAGAHQWDRMEWAARLDPVAAPSATSWGLFQIMGFNHEACGFDDVAAMVAAMRRGQPQQLGAFVSFVRRDRVLQYALSRDPPDFAAFALHYNGPAYAENGYAVRLAAAFGRWTAARAQAAAGDAQPKVPA